MGQHDVVEFLKEKRKQSGDWYEAKEIIKGLREKGLEEGALNNVYDNLRKLTVFNIIQAKGLGLWNYKVVFRAKKK